MAHWLVAGERAGADHGEPAGDLLAAGAGQQPGALDVDPGEHERGRDALGEVFQRVGRFRAGAGGDVEVVDLVDAYMLVRVSVQTPQTASMMSVMLARRVTGRPRNRANSAAIIFGVAAGGTVM